MKATGILYGILMVVIMSCNKEGHPHDCNGSSAGLYKHGFAYAQGSYQDFGDYATLVRERVADTITGLWKHDEIEKSIFLTSINNHCTEKIIIGIKNLDIRSSDTIHLKYSFWGLSREFETSNLHILDGDAGIETYHLLEGEGVSNWVLIESINSDTTEIAGKFQLSFITGYEDFLTGERERWDDPNRPDTLHYTNGEFIAEFMNY